MTTPPVTGVVCWRCAACGHEFLASARWRDATPCPCCSYPASRSRNWILLSAEVAVLGALTWLFWAYWWF